MKKKHWIVLATIIGAVLFTIISYMIYTHTENRESTKIENDHHKQLKNDTKAVKVAIVNEDKATQYHEQKIALGKTFINMLKNDKDHQFETVSRGAAESGLKNGSYQVMVIVPNNFSERAMQLDEKFPKSMFLEYKTAVGQKEILAKETEKVVSKVLNQFNHELIRIYLTSIIDNLHLAQKNVNQMIERDNDFKKSYTEFLLNPINDFSGQFSNVTTQSDDSNQLVTDWINQFNHSSINQSSDIFNINKDTSVSSIINKQQTNHSEEMTLMDKFISQYEKNNESVDLNKVIQTIEQENEKVSNQLRFDGSNREKYAKTFDERLNRLQLAANESQSPFSDEKIKEYRKALKLSLTRQINENPDLLLTMKKYRANNQEVLKQMNQEIVDEIKRDSPNDKYYIPSFDPEDIDKLEEVKDKPHYKEIMKHLNIFVDDYNAHNPSDPISKEKIHDIDAIGQEDNTESLIDKGLPITKEKTIKGKGITKVHLSFDSRFTYKGNVLINGKKYDIKNDDVEIKESDEDITIKIDGTAFLKRSSVDEIKENPKMLWQILVHQKYNGDPIVDENGAEIESSNPANDKNENVNFYDITIEENIDHVIYKPSLSQGLEVYERFDRLYTNLYSTKDSNGIPKQSIFEQLNSASLDDDLVNEMINILTADLKQFDQDKTQVVEDIKELQKEKDTIISEMSKSYEETTTHNSELKSLLTDVKDMNEKFSDKPKPVETTINKDKEISTISSKMDEDISQLISNSQELLTDSQSSKSIGESISSKLVNLDSGVNQLNASGKTLGIKANDINKAMTNDTESDEQFANNFLKVLENSKDGDRQNEALKSFMSKPIDTLNIDNVLTESKTKHTVSPSLLVFVMFLISLMTAYLLSSYERTKSNIQLIQNDFSKNSKLYNNIAKTGVITGIALIEGIVISLIAMNKFEIIEGYRFKFIMLVICSMILFTLINTYLLRQLRSIGMFLILLILTLYFVSLDGITFNGRNLINERISPISYIDQMIYNFLNLGTSIIGPITITIIFILVAFVLNVFVKTFKKEGLV